MKTPKHKPVVKKSWEVRYESGLHGKWHKMIIHRKSQAASVRYMNWINDNFEIPVRKLQLFEITTTERRVK